MKDIIRVIGNWLQNKLCGSTTIDSEDIKWAWAALYRMAVREKRCKKKVAIILKWIYAILIVIIATLFLLDTILSIIVSLRSFF